MNLAEMLMQHVTPLSQWHPSNQGINKPYQKEKKETRHERESQEKKDAIFALLDKPKTTRQISQELGTLTPDAVRKHLYGLLDQGLVRVSQKAPLNYWRA